MTRDAGADRFAASLSVAQDAFTTSDTAYLATGLNYPDGLDTAALAGHTAGPLLLIQGNCVPQNVEQELISLHAAHVTILGGDDSLGSDIDGLEACAS